MSFELQILVKWVKTKRPLDQRIFHNSFFSHTLTDLELAAVSGYPDHLRHKLLNRHAKTLAEIYRFKEAEQKFKEAIEAVDKST